MIGIQTTIRTMVAELIEGIRDGSVTISEFAQFVIPIFSVEETYFPQHKLEDFTDEVPKVKLVCIGFASNRDRLLRNKSTEVIVPVQVAIQSKVDQTDVTKIDQLVLFAEQVQLACENDQVFEEEDGTKHNYSWMTTEPLRDENGLIYSYQQLVNEGIFQVIFTVQYKYLLTRSC